MRATLSSLRVLSGRPALFAGVLVLFLSAGLAAAAPEAGDPGTETIVQVERAKPRKEKRPTLRFLKSNRDWIRGELDRVREKTKVKRMDAESLDPRYLAYQDMLSRILATRDSLAVAADARERRQLLESVTKLGDLESELDQLERQLADQRQRLARIQSDFVGDQRTALVVVLSGSTSQASLEQVALTIEDDTPLVIPITEAEREALRRGGAVQIFHGFVEPREQVLEVALHGDRWPSEGAGFVTLDPARDRLTVLRLDLTKVHLEQGAPGLEATTWLQDERIP